MIHASEERNYKIPQRSHADTSPEPSKSKSFGLASMLNVLTTPFRASQEDTSAQVTARPYSHIVVHAGTNNLSEKDDENDITTIGKEAEVLCSTIRNKQPTAKIVISGICPRADRVLPATKVEPANTALRRVAEENRALFVDNEGSFQYRNGRLDTTLYDKDLLHINRKRGASRLIANICEVVPTILPTTRPPANKQWDLLANRSPLYGAGPPPVPRSPDGGTRHTQRPRQQYTGESTRRNAHAEPMQHHMQHHNSMHMQNQWQWYPDSTRREQRPRWIAGEPPCHFCGEPGHITHPREKDESTEKKEKGTKGKRGKGNTNMQQKGKNRPE
ncbi:Hypp6870 [Branchiostoma lanceolatum]|uniref:1-alkyl-2-acetylglycerophosphocholine esterase n=1 Tax=Branchiostoma lanceolatum TaxID=7740 RepID=A0A8K0E5B7_BRALA|nr:Hypp6870 [Branchiostoma lanceolatum]